MEEIREEEENTLYAAEDPFALPIRVNVTSLERRTDVHPARVEENPRGRVVKQAVRPTIRLDFGGFRTHALHFEISDYLRGQITRYSTRPSELDGTRPLIEQRFLQITDQGRLYDLTLGDLLQQVIRWNWITRGGRRDLPDAVSRTTDNRSRIGWKIVRVGDFRSQETCFWTEVENLVEDLEQD